MRAENHVGVGLRVQILEDDLLEVRVLWDRLYDERRPFDHVVEVRRPGRGVEDDVEETVSVLTAPRIGFLTEDLVSRSGGRRVITCDPVDMIVPIQFIDFTDEPRGRARGLDSSRSG